MKIEEFFRPESVQTKHPLFLIKKAFIIERDSAAAKAVWMSLDDQEGSRVQTEVVDKADGDKTISHRFSSSEYLQVHPEFFLDAKCRAHTRQHFGVGVLFLEISRYCVADELRVSAFG